MSVLCLQFAKGNNQIKVTFTESQRQYTINNGAVEYAGIKNGDDDDLPEIVMDDDETEIPAAIELNAIQELFNNIGRFSPAGMGQ